MTRGYNPQRAELSANPMSNTAFGKKNRLAADSPIYLRGRNLIFGTAVVFTLAPLAFGILGLKMGIVLSVSDAVSILLMNLAVHAFAAILYPIAPASSATFLLTSLVQTTGVLASWTGGISSPVLWLLPGISFVAAFFFGRKGALFAALGVAAVVGLIGGFEPATSFNASLAILALAMFSTAFGATIDEGLAAEKRYRSALQAAWRSERTVALSVLAAGFAHEVKNPVAGILSFIANWKEETNESDRQKLILIEKNLANILELVEKTRRWDGRFIDSAAPIDISVVINEILDLFRNFIRDAKVDFETDLGPAVINAGADQVRQAILNLIINAISFAGPGGRFRVTTMTRGGRVILSVEDSGPGVSEENKKKIFEPFFSTRSSGTGMGLAVVHSVFESLQGRIEIARSDLGGAAFVISLPVAEAI